jgi:hypothetical protein
MYLCAVHGAGFSNTVFQRTIKMTSIPAVSTNAYDTMYNDDVRVEVTVTYARPTGIIKKVKVIDFIRARV